MTVHATILFDFDGTIADTGPGISFAIAATLAELGLPSLPPETLRLFVGPPLRESFEVHCGVPHEQVEDVVRIYRKHYGADSLLMAQTYPGIRDSLTALHAAGHTLAVATAKPEQYAIRILDHLGLLDYFATVAGATFDGTLGEKDDIIEVALTRLGVDASRDRTRTRADVLMVGDRNYDVDGAAEFGIQTIGAGWGYGTDGELADAGALRILDDAGNLAWTIDAILHAEDA